MLGGVVLRNSTRSDVARPVGEDMGGPSSRARLSRAASFHADAPRPAAGVGPLAGRASSTRGSRGSSDEGFGTMGHNLERRSSARRAGSRVTTRSGEVWGACHCGSGQRSLGLRFSKKRYDARSGTSVSSQSMMRVRRFRAAVTTQPCPPEDGDRDVPTPIRPGTAPHHCGGAPPRAATLRRSAPGIYATVEVGNTRHDLPSSSVRQVV